MAVFITGGGVAPKVGDENTLLLIHGEEIKDSSQYGNSIENTGVIVSSDQSKFGNKSLYFNGSARLKIKNASLLSSGGDFTIDWWEYRTQLNKQGAVFNQTYTPGGAFGLLLGYCDSSKCGVFAGNSSTWQLLATEALGSADLNVWNHLAVVRRGNNILCYKNGVQTYSSSFSATFAMSQYPYIGYYDYAQAPSYFYGYIDEFRVSDVARWTSNFTPPVEPYRG